MLDCEKILNFDKKFTWKNWEINKIKVYCENHTGKFSNNNVINTAVLGKPSSNIVVKIMSL